MGNCCCGSDDQQVIKGADDRSSSSSDSSKEQSMGSSKEQAIGSSKVQRSGSSSNSSKEQAIGSSKVQRSGSSSGSSSNSSKEQVIGSSEQGIGISKEQGIGSSYRFQLGDNNPRPMIFALMRNGHEVIRGAMEDISEEIATQTSRGDYADVDKIIEMWNDLHAWEGMHKTMEEGKGVKGSPKTSPVGFFELLDRKYDGIATKNGLLDAHDELDELEDAMHNACHLKDLWRIRRAWTNFEEANSAHLKKEESIMMAKVTELAESGENLKDMMRNEIFALIANSPDLKFFIQFANRILDTHPGGMPRARVFDHALYAIATPQEWTTWQVWIKASLTKARYAEVRAAIYPEEESPKLYSPDVPQFVPYAEATSGDEAEC